MKALHVHELEDERRQGQGFDKQSAADVPGAEGRAQPMYGAGVAGVRLADVVGWQGVAGAPSLELHRANKAGNWQPAAADAPAVSSP